MNNTNSNNFDNLSDQDQIRIILKSINKHLESIDISLQILSQNSNIELDRRLDNNKKLYIQEIHQKQDQKKSPEDDYSPATEKQIYFLKHNQRIQPLISSYIGDDWNILSSKFCQKLIGYIKNNNYKEAESYVVIFVDKLKK